MSIDSTALITFGVYALTELLKRMTFIPISEGQKTRIRVVVTVLAFVTAGVTAYLNGNWTQWLSTQDVQVVLQTGVIVIGTWVIHKIRNGLTKLWAMGSNDMFHQN